MQVADPGEGPGGPTTTPLLALYSNQTEAQKIFWETRHPTPYLRVGMTGPLLPPPPPLLLFSKSGSGTTCASYFFFLWVKVIAKIQSAVHYIRTIIKWCGFSVHQKSLVLPFFEKCFKNSYS